MNPTTCFETEKKRSYNHQNRVLGVLEAIWASKHAPTANQKYPSNIDHGDVLELKMKFWARKWTSWAQWYIAIADLKDSFYIEIGELSKSAIMFSALKLSTS